MKKVVLFLALALSTSAFSQLAPPPQKIDLHLTNVSKDNILDNSRHIPVGPIMLLGGASFILAGALTPPVMVGGSTTEKKPFFQQGARAAAIISGCVVITGGVVISLGGY
jgi:hypothetical protein